MKSEESEELEESILEHAISNYMFKDKLSLDDFVHILDMSESEIEPIIQTLINKKVFICDKNSNYFPNLKNREVKKLYKERCDSFAKNITRYLPERYKGKDIIKGL